MALEWKIDNPSFTEYVVEDVFAIETAASKYFSDLLAERSLSTFQPPNRFVDVTVSVRRQTLSGDNMVTETTLNVYHVGNSGIANLSDFLQFVTNKNTTGSEDFLVLDSLIGMNVKVGMVSFANAKESLAMAGGFESFYVHAKKDLEDEKKYSESEKTLIVVTSILSFALFGLSVILIWVAGGWLALRHQVKVLIHREEERTRLSVLAIEQKPTQDTEDTNPEKDEGTEFTNPSGFLGGNPFYGKSVNNFDGLGIKMTPQRPRRSDLDSEIGTPMSEYSDSGRMPIGIQSMRKLLANRTNDNDFALDTYGTKRFDYNNE